jgi:hypothetical protein
MMWVIPASALIGLTHGGEWLLGSVHEYLKQGSKQRRAAAGKEEATPVVLVVSGEKLEMALTPAQLSRILQNQDIQDGVKQEAIFKRGGRSLHSPS